MQDDSWKDGFLLREYITGLELLQLPKEQKDWLEKHNRIFKQLTNEDRLINLLHPRNVNFKSKNKI